MALQTISDIAFTSPVARLLQGNSPATQSQVAQSVGLADRSGQPLTHVRGANLQSALADIPANVGDVTEADNSLLVRLRHDTVLVIGDTAQNLQNALDDTLLTVTDITHGRGQLLLVGHHAADVLAKTCGLDFADRAFPNNHAAQTSLAKVRATIVRNDRDNVPAYHLIVGYSVAEYVWGVVFDAINEFGGDIFSA